MSGSTTRIGLYLPGGGSTNAYGADEVADIDKLNQSFVKLDGAVYPSVASHNALAALTTLPEGAVVAVRQYNTAGGKLHQASLWQWKGGVTWQPLTDIQFYVANYADLIAGAAEISSISGLFIPTGWLARNGSNSDVISWTGTTWKLWAGYTDVSAGGITLPGAVTNWGSGFNTKARVANGLVTFSFCLKITATTNTNTVVATLPAGFRPITGDLVPFTGVGYDTGGYGWNGYSANLSIDGTTGALRYQGLSGVAGTGGAPALGSGQGLFGSVSFLLG